MWPGWITKRIEQRAFQDIPDTHEGVTDRWGWGLRWAVRWEAGQAPWDRLREALSARQGTSAKTVI